jgi:ribosomal protein L3 glutamine methyltransferase
MPTRNQQHETVGALIQHLSTELARAGVCFGHGTGSALDEAAALVFHVAGLSHAEAPAAYAQRLSQQQRAAADALVRRRIEQRLPLPYLTHEAWFADLRFYVDERVLVPRSPVAELINRRFAPWLGEASVGQILELGTGSGCIAIACAAAFPECRVLATDISSAALQVARINVARHAMQDRVRLVQADLFAGLAGSFDLVISNPPYVPENELSGLTGEYHHEPRQALTSGVDGLAAARRILQDAANYLSPGGVLVLEVGAGWAALERAFPKLPFIWPDLESGGEGVAIVQRAALLTAV